MIDHLMLVRTQPISTFRSELRAEILCIEDSYAIKPRAAQGSMRSRGEHRCIFNNYFFDPTTILRSINSH